MPSILLFGICAGVAFRFALAFASAVSCASSLAVAFTRASPCAGAFAIDFDALPCQLHGVGVPTGLQHVFLRGQPRLSNPVGEYWGKLAPSNKA